MAYTTIDDPSAYFQTTLYTGNATDDTAITHGGNSDLQADWVWIKNRDVARDHILFDSVRGAGVGIKSNTVAGNASDSTQLQSFDSDGFTVGIENDANENTKKMVSWSWKESTTAGFDIVSFTGNGSTTQTVSHNLSAVPKVIIIKRLDQNANWCVYHESLGGADHNLFLNTTNPTQTDTAIFNNTLPTTSVFSLGNNADANGDGAPHIAYVFAEKQGFSKFNKFMGNGNANGTFVYTGFRPAWVMFTNTANGGHWQIYDTKIGASNVVNDHLKANSSGAEIVDDANEQIDILSNGFKCRGTSNNNNNHSGDTYVYLAFAESPFVTSTGVPTTAR